MRQPNSVSKNSNISDQLKLIRHSLWLDNFNPLFLLYGLFVLFVIFDASTLMAFYDDFVLRGLASTSFWFFLSFAGGLLWLLVDTFKRLSTKPLSLDQKQSIPVRLDSFIALIAGVSILCFLLGLILFAHGKLTSPDATSNASFLVFGGGLLLISAIGSLSFLYGEQALQPFRNLWQRVSITGYLDREKYEVGDTILFQMRDRLTMHDKNLYRVHLQYVHEYLQNIGTGESATKKTVRQVRHQKFVDVSGEKLYAGVRLSTVEFQKFNTKGSKFGKRPEYWEILVEEHGGTFYGRFFVNIASSRI